LFNVLGGALALRARSLIGGYGPIPGHLYPAAGRFRPAILITLTAQAIVFSSLALASYFYIRPMPLHAPSPPSPPPAPAPPVEITDPAVFPGVPQVYSSLPLPSDGNELVFTSVVRGVGICFLPLLDIGLTDRHRNPVRRVWPGQALEREITRREIPKYPVGALNPGGVVSVSLEYVIGIDGSVRVLRSSGPALFDKAARAALERWSYRPIRFEGHVIEVVSRVEVKFDAELARGKG
jgi:TonB family protein